MATTTSEAFEVRAGERQLFLDTAGVAEIENLTHRMHCPQKKGTVIRGDYLKHPGCSIQTRSAPIWDSEKEVYKLWVMGVAPAPPHITVQGDFSGYYESKDGLNWYLPVVGEVDYGGSQENNFVTAKVSGRYARTDCVVYDKTDPDPQRRFKASIPDCWHGCDWHTECTGGFAVSPDGIHWTESSSPGIPSYDEWGLSFDEREGLFIHYVKFSDPTFGYRSVYLSTSTDFETWTEPKLVFCADEEDQQVAPRRIAGRLADKTRLTPEYNVPETYRAEVYHMSIFRYESHYIGLPAFSYHTGSVPKDWPGFDEMNLSPAIKELVHTHGDYTWFYELQLASSRDLYHWTRLGDRQPWLENSPLGAGDYDLQTIIGPADVVVRDDELWFYYTGLKRYGFIMAGEKPGYDDYLPDKGGICLAVLRRDGFVSLEAGGTEGHVRTLPFELNVSRLFVNVDAPDGELQVEVLDADRSVARSYPINGDLLRAEVTWFEGGIDGLRGPTSLRFTLRNGHLYSYWFE